MKWGILLILVMGLAWSGPLGVVASPISEAADAGAWSPEGCWLCEGGSPSRAARSFTRPVRGTLTPAWSQKLGGEIEGEPRVWWDRILVPVRTGPDRRELHVLNLSDGSPIGKPLKVKTDYPLRPSIWEDELLIRTGADTVALYRVRRGRFSLKRSWTAAGTVLDLLWWKHRAYVLTGSALQCFIPNRRAPTWEARGSWMGRLCVAGLDLLAVRYETDSTNMQLISLGLDDGSTHGKAGVGYATEGKTVRHGHQTRVVALDEFIFVHHRWPVNAAGGGKLSASRVRRAPHEGHTALVSAGLFNILKPVVGYLDGWIALNKAEDGSTAVVLVRKDPKRKSGYGEWILGDKAAHQDIVRAMPDYAVARDVCFAGAKSFDLDSLHVLWDGRAPLLFRPIPARNTLLVVKEPSTLTAMRTADRAARRPVYLGPAHQENAGAGPTPGTERVGDILMNNGDVISGRFAFLPDRAGVETLTGRKTVRRTPRSLTRVRAIADDEGRLLFVGALEDLVPAVDTLALNRNAEAYCALTRIGLKARDVELLAMLIDVAEERGGSEKRLKTPIKKIEELRRNPKTVRDKYVKSIRDKIAELSKGEAAFRIQAVDALLDDPRPYVHGFALDQVLLRDPKHPEALKRVRKMLPAFIRPPEPFDGRAWHALAAVLARTPVRRVDPPRGETPDMTVLQRELGAATHYWRKDLVGLQSEQLFFITPFQEPANTARCLSTAELVCDAMEMFFADQPKVRTKRDPIVIQAFERPEYYAHVLSRGQPDPWLRRNLKTLVGWYDSGDHVTRVIVPEGDNAMRRVIDTFTSELTQHWMDTRCPIWKANTRHYDKELPGAWIHRGLPYFLEEWDWNLERRSWNTLVPSAWSIDLVANATQAQLLDWNLVFGLSDRRRRGVPLEPTMKINMRFQVGWFWRATPRTMYAAQSAATWNYLHHQGGRLRDGAMRLLREWNEGKVPNDEKYLKAYLGMSARELGKRVVTWARDLQRGKAHPKVEVRHTK